MWPSEITKIILSVVIIVSGSNLGNIPFFGSLDPKNNLSSHLGVGFAEIIMVTML